MPSKHAEAGHLIRRGLFDNLNSFSELEQRIGALGDENSKTVGDAFEIFVEAYLATHQKLQAQDVWLVGQLPLEIHQQLNLPNNSKGIDGVFRTRTGILVPYQVKFRSQRAYLTFTELAPFLGLTERAKDRIIFTNSNELSADVKNRDAIRTVRGIDFDDLTKDDLRRLSVWLKGQPVPIPKLTPHSYQVDALRKIERALARSDRAHVVMACGTGKTLVALWAAEQVRPKTVLVLVPSLTLLQQTLDEWSRHNSWGSAFTYLCVCSDPSVEARDESDPVLLDTMDLDFHVDTSPAEVHRFLKNDTSNIKVVFSTYQSSPVVAEGMRDLEPFDIAIYDEAHKTTGPRGGLFAHCLSDENICIRKRLFFTATPRHYDILHRDREGDFCIISMDDEKIYGPRAYTLTFGEAAQRGIICNYKVVISLVDGEEITTSALKHGITLVEGDRIGARWVANQIATERAIEKTGAKRAITFHNRVSGAREFSSDTSRGIKQYLPEFSVFHVNGSQRTSERKQIIRAFRDAERALVTNARCLTEGIDLPAVDMVAFINPRHSKVDIAQATGRAMRKARGSDKEVGYVVVPLFLERKTEETLEEALERSEFDGVSNVLNAMREQDEDLVEIIRELQELKGRGEIFNPRRLSEKVEVLGPSIELSTLRSNIFAEIVDAIGISWDEWFGRLKHYKEREGHCRVHQHYKDNGFGLGQWVSDQRQNKDTLAPDRRRRLDELGFIWNPLETDWEEGFQCLKCYASREGHCRVPQRHKENGVRLGQWVSNQRQSRELLPESRRQRLDEIGFVWDVLEEGWEEGFHHLRTYAQREGHCRVPRHHEEVGFALGKWVRTQRSNNILSQERRQRLDALGFVWDPFETAWEQGFGYLKSFAEREGHTRVPTKHEENDFRLGAWVVVQRGNKDALSQERLQKLDELGFQWDPFGEAWEEGLGYLRAFFERERHTRVPTKHEENDFRLGLWVGVQRRSKDALSQERLQRLDELGFEWDPLGTAWEDGFGYLKAFAEREGHTRVPQDHRENDFALGQWVSVQRKNMKTMTEDRRKRLDQIGFVWGSFEASWEEGFTVLRCFKRREGHTRVPYSYKEDTYALGRWVSRQRQNNKKGILSDERRQRLDEIGFDWDFE